MPLASQGILAWDRYAFVSNNPTTFIDPSGHGVQKHLWSETEGIIPASSFGVKFKGNWKPIEMAYVEGALQTLGKRFAGINGGTPYDAFKEVYGVNSENQFVFEMGTCEECNHSGAYTHSSRDIEFDEEDPFSALFERTYRTIPDTIEINIHTVIHEFGHAFAGRYSNNSPLNPYHGIEKIDTFLTGEGYAPEGPGMVGLWRPNPSTSSNETFANMFLGWTYNQWGNDVLGIGKRRNFFMETNMAYWTSVLSGR